MPLLYWLLLSNVQKQVLETHWDGQGIRRGWTRGGIFCSRSFGQREISIAYLWLEGVAGKGRVTHHTCVPISVSTKGLGQDWVSTGPSWFPCFSLHYTKLPIRNACLRTEWHTFPACCLPGSQRNKRKPAMKRKMRQSEQKKRKGKEQSQYPAGPRGGDGRS